MARIPRKEQEETFVVISGFVGVPDSKGNVEDVMPYERYKSGANKGKCKRVNEELVWKYTEYKALPSKVGHIVASGKLCLKSEFPDFYPDLAVQAGMLDPEDVEYDDEDSGDEE